MVVLQPRAHAHRRRHPDASLADIPFNRVVKQIVATERNHHWQIGRLGKISQCGPTTIGPTATTDQQNRPFSGRQQAPHGRHVSGRRLPFNHRGRRQRLNGSGIA